MKSPQEGETINGDNNITIKNGVVTKGTKGAEYGGIIGGLAGLLIGIAAVVIPGAGGFLFAGPLAAVLGLHGAVATTFTGAFAGAATGGLVGVFEGLGVPKETAQHYEKQINAGGVLVAVATTSENEEQAQNILERHNAEQIRTITVDSKQEKVFHQSM